MFVAQNELGQKVYATETLPKDDKYYCPLCKKEVRLRAGSINVPHFAHINSQDCDDFSSDMSEWHREWQSLFPKGNREYIIEHHDEKHRADVCCYSTVIEFQHSPISEEEFWRRNEFYTAAGYKVVWIFDMIDLYDGYDSSGRLYHVDEWSNKYGNGGKYQWKYPFRFLGGFMPQDEKNIAIFFQIVGHKNFR